MFRPQIQKTQTLVALAVFCAVMVYWSFHSTVVHESRGYEDKINATDIMSSALKSLKTFGKTEKNVIIYKDIDPNFSGLIFKDDTKLKTGPGDLESKQTTLKPNFSALVVDLLIEAGVKTGDTIAVGMTGSMPGANIALYSACESLNVVPIVISSVGASMWGATDTNYTWLDMENHLYNENIISYKSIAASLGGVGDCLRKDGNFGGAESRRIAEKAIDRNNVNLIDYEVPRGRKNLSKSIEQRMELYRRVGSLSSYSVYVNIGGGVSSLGVGGGDKVRKSGVLSADVVNSYDLNNSVAKVFAENGIQIIHILQIPKLVKNIIPWGSDKLPIGEGKLFYDKRYNLLVTVFALLLSLGSVIAVGIVSHRQIKKRMSTFEPESVI
ncbi:MAG: poly-gamma-glutamate system protein [Candidatus Marinimicrobia bacterium]|nr:poly-gamma-glutamate system protein [Candidatus Neomarinimicrobiota bacterium]MBL7023192.1 poly-gamma-glutamate system protein [Candidatus Neomarinimicrobiota bacterium]MBL7109247.1 poly-gamma-glutamate system protein [Candidatus Neomarinimicrobiota bacterium]